jgi:hypothetical protein
VIVGCHLPHLQQLSGHQDQLLLIYGQKEARIFTLQGTESSPDLVPQLYRNLFSSLEGRLRPIASHEPSGLHHTVPQDPYQATATRKEVLMNLAGVRHSSLPQGLSQDAQLASLDPGVAALHTGLM